MLPAIFRRKKRRRTAFLEKQALEAYARYLRLRNAHAEFNECSGLCRSMCTAKAQAMKNWQAAEELLEEALTTSNTQLIPKKENTP